MSIDEFIKAYYPVHLSQWQYDILKKHEDMKKAKKKMSMSDYVMECYSTPTPITWGSTPQYNTSSGVMTVQVEPANTFTLGSTVTIQKAPACAKTNGNETMYINNEAPIANQQKAYLAERASKTFRTQESKLLDTFNINNPPAPRTAEDLIDRITNKKYTVKTEDLKKTPWDGASAYFDWRTTPADEAGYEAARTELKTQYTTTADAIMIKDADAGLAAIQALEAWTPTGKAN